MGDHLFHTNSTTGLIEQFNEVDWVGFRLNLFTFVLGIVGNVAAIFVIIFFDKKKRSAALWYILQLIAVDAIFLLSIPFQMDEISENKWKFGSFMCIGKNTILFLNYYASILFLVIMSVDRYIAVCHGYSGRLQKLQKPFFIIIIATVAWLIAICLSIPIMMHSRIYGTQPNCRCMIRFPPVESAEEICTKEGMLTEKEFQQCVEFHQFDECKDDANITLLFPMEYDDEFDDSWLPAQDDIYENYTWNFYDLNSTYDDINDYDVFNDSDIVYIDKIEVSTLYNSIVIFNFVGMFLFPFMIILFFMVNVFRSPPTPINNIEGAVPLQDANEVRREKRWNKAKVETNKLNKIHALMCILFFICWLPWHISHLFRMVRIGDGSSMKMTVEQVNIFRKILYVTSFASRMKSAFNPFIFLFVRAKKPIKRKNTRRQKIKNGNAMETSL